MTRILVVEDSPTQLERVRLILEEDGFEVEAARDGQEGREKLEASRFDLIVSDIVMPRSSGYALCRWAKSDAKTKHVPVILLTSLNDPMDLILAVEAGADSFISKPYEPDYLLARIREILEGRRLRPEGKLSENVEILFMGRRFAIGTGKEQILTLLLSAFEDMVRTNRELRATQAELSEAKEKLEGRARASEEMYGTLMREASDSILLTDAEGIVLEANLRAATLVGRPISDMVGRSATDFVPAAQRSGALSLLDELAAERDVPPTEVVIERPDGSTADVEATLSMVEVQGRKVVFALLRDVTEKRRAAARAEAQYEVTRILAEAQTLADAAPELLRAIGTTLGWERGGYWQVDREVGALRHLAAWRVAPGEEGYFDAVSRALILPCGSGLPGRVWESRQASWVPDVAQDDAFQRAGAAVSEGLRTWVGFPVFSDGEVQGVVELLSRESRQPDDDLLQRLATFGSQIGQFVERRRADQARRTSEERFRRLFDSKAIGIAIEDLSGHTLDANPAYLDMLGYGQAELDAGMLRWTESTPPEYRERDQVAVDELRTTGVARPWEKELLRQDGSRVPVLIGVAMLQEEGERCITYVVDLRDLKRAEESARKLLHAVEQAENIIFITDPAGALTYVNSAFERTYGFRRDEVLGKTPRILKSGRHDDAFYRRLWAGLLSGEGVRSEIVNKTRDGQLLTLEMFAKPVLDAQGRRIGFISVENDITAKKVLEEQLRVSQKMEAIGQLAGGIAHDFNNLLTAIIGYADLLESGTALAETERSFVAEIQKASARAAGLTRQLLAFSRKQVLETVVLSPNHLIRNLEAMLRRLIREDVDLAIRLEPSTGSVRADAGQLEQVIMNLVVNARDAMPRGGELAIETRNVDLDEGYAQRHAVVRPGPYVMIAVNDTGDGMDAATQARIFEPFFTTKGVGKGTGLGLSIVYGIVKQSGGNVWVYSEPGKGTTFKVYLPRVEEAPVESELVSSVVVPERGTETILLVEDESSIRKLAQKLLESRGYRVLEASNGAEALDLIRTSADPIHLLLTDVVMPGMAGTELAGLFLESRPQARVICMSGYSDHAVLLPGAAGHGLRFLEKPFTPQILLRKVREALSSP